MRPDVVIEDKPAETDRQAILDGLVAFNNAAAGPSGYEPVAIILRDPSDGGAIGGLWGKVSYGWLFIELLFVPQHLRGQKLGVELMRKAEAVALKHGCVGIWLDTYGFQAPAFYRALGYEVFGEIADHPKGTTRFFLRKAIRDSR
jgi:GNAT superfamily N-acetyltransferase